MRWRGLIKSIVYGARPFYRGAFPYWGYSVYFPRNTHIFKRACAEGIYEQDLVMLIDSLIESGKVYIDVGANIGLLSVPVLASHKNARVISIEASPAACLWLNRTLQNSDDGNRWSIFNCAVGDESGEASYYVSNNDDSTFEGLKDTGRGGGKRKVTVPVRTIDELWKSCGSPPVSVIKMDIEGGERAALMGARQVIEHEEPSIIIEWNAVNLAAYGIEPSELLNVCRTLRYTSYAVPGLYAITNERLLRITMARTESFLLIPN